MWHTINATARNKQPLFESGRDPASGAGSPIVSLLLAGRVLTLIAFLYAHPDRIRFRRVRSRSLIYGEFLYKLLMTPTPSVAYLNSSSISFCRPLMHVNAKSVYMCGNGKLSLKSGLIHLFLVSVIGQQAGRKWIYKVSNQTLTCRVYAHNWHWLIESWK